MNPRLDNVLAAERARLGWSQARMAEAAGISRQSYAAIEAGAAVPSTEVALRLAQALGRTVEELFRLPGKRAAQRLAAWAGSTPAAPGRRVRLTRISGRWVAHPVGEAHRPTPPADGVVERVVEGETIAVRLLPDAPPPSDLAVMGCDPAFGIVADALRRERGVEVTWTQRGSRAALAALARGEAHVVGAHLRDAATGEGNDRWIRDIVPFPCTRIAFAVWQQGLLLRPGDAARISGPADLARPGIRLVNREEGSGSRMLLDEALAAAKVDASSIAGYDTRAAGHLAVAETVASGAADVGVGIRAAGVAWGLDVLPLREEEYELIVPDHFLDLPAVGALLDVLRRPGTRAQVEALQGYDGQRMGLPA